MLKIRLKLGKHLTEIKKEKIEKEWKLNWIMMKIFNNYLKLNENGEKSVKNAKNRSMILKNLKIGWKLNENLKKRGENMQKIDWK